MQIVYGKNPVKELILSGQTINKIYVAKGVGGLTEIVNLAKQKKIPIVNTDKIKLDKMVEEKNSQGIVAAYTDYKYYDIEDILKLAKKRGEDPFVIILDRIEDPQNLGAIVRSAECMGAHGIIIPKRNACLVDDTVEKISAGAVSYMMISRVANISDAIKKLKDNGLWIYGLDMSGNLIQNENLTGPIGIVIGNEGEGMSQLVTKNCDGVIKIDMVGKLDSLNASVSAGIAMYEVKRQRNFKNI